MTPPPAWLVLMRRLGALVIGGIGVWVLFDVFAGL